MWLISISASWAPSLLGIPASQTDRIQEVSKIRCFPFYRLVVVKTGHDRKSGVLARIPFQAAISRFNKNVERTVFTSA